MNTAQVTENQLILPVENGESAAKVLPLDKQVSTIGFETATFGLG